MVVKKLKKIGKQTTKYYFSGFVLNKAVDGEDKLVIYFLLVYLTVMKINPVPAKDFLTVSVAAGHFPRSPGSHTECIYPECWT